MNKQFTVLATIAGTLICALFALLFFRVAFLDLDHPPFYIVALGFIGSLTLALFKKGRVRDGIYINIMFFFVMTIVIAAFIRPITALIFLIYTAGMTAALYVHVSAFEQKIGQIPWSQPLLLAAEVGLVFIAATLVHGLMFISGLKSTFLLANLPMGFLLGLGQGLGHEVVERWLLSEKVDRAKA